MNPFERTDEVTHVSPQPFGGVAMDFTKAIAVIITRPLMPSMTDAVAWPSDAIVALIFIGVENGLALCEAFRMGSQRDPFGVRHHPQPYLSRFPSHRAQNRRAIIGIRAPSALFVRTTTGWISQVKVFVTFFPPRSETSHRFQ